MHHGTRWRRAGTLISACVTRLRAHMGRRDPAPWYLMLGDPGSGKSTLVRRSHRQAIMTIHRAASRDVDVFQVADAVLLDTSAPDPRSRDGRDARWAHAIDLALHARRRVDGVLLVVSAAHLRDHARARVDADSRIDALRARLHMASRRCGVRIPVHVLVTQCDTLYGFESWAGALEPHDTARVLGARCDPDTEIDHKIDSALTAVARQLHAHRRRSLQRTGDVIDMGRQLMLPLEIETLRAPLRRDLGALFRAEPTDASARLCSIHFCCARRCGGARAGATALSALPTHADSDDGHFLPAILAVAIIPNRPRPEATETARRQRKRWQRLAWITWVALACAAAAAVGAAAGSAQRLIALRHELEQPLDFRDVTAMLRADAEIRRTASTSPLVWWIATGAGLGDLPARQRQRFLGSYRQGQSSACADLGPWPARDLASMAQRVHVLQGRVDGNDLPQIRLHWPANTPRTDEARALAIAALSHTAPSDHHLLTCLRTARRDFDDALGRDEPWEDMQRAPPLPAAVREIRASDFWHAVPGAFPSAVDAVLPARATQAASRAIEAMLVTMRAASSDPLAFDVRSAQFRQTWLDRRMASWAEFATAFAAGPPPLAGERGWRVALDTLTGADNPYARLLRTIAAEFSDQPVHTLPRWLALARSWSGLQAQSRRFGGRGAVLRTVAATHLAATAALRDMLGLPTDAGPRRVDEIATLLTVIARFEARSAELATAVTAGRASALRALSALHRANTDMGGDEAASAAYDAWSSLNALHTAITTSETDRRADPAGMAPFWGLVAAPLYRVLDYARQQAGCALQAQWERDVLWTLHTTPATGAQRADPIGARSSVFGFASGPARPFLARHANDTAVQVTEGIRAPLLDALPALLDRAVSTQRDIDQARSDAEMQARARAQALENARAELARVETRMATRSKLIEAARTRRVPLRIEAQPTGTSARATARPSLTTLEIACDDARHVLPNYNFPVSMSLQWSPSHCDGVTLTLVVGTVVLHRSYPGPLGVAAMLEDFAGGSRTFIPAEFPLQEPALRAAGVQWMTVHYAVEGRAQALQTAALLDAQEKAQRRDLVRLAQIQDTLAESAVRLAAGADETRRVSDRSPVRPPDVPVRIAPCWNPGAEQDQAQSASTGVSSQ